MTKMEGRVYIVAMADDPKLPKNWVFLFHGASCK
jgi:hypothetical protein